MNGSDIHTSVNDKRDNFGFPIVNRPNLEGFPSKGKRYRHEKVPDLHNESFPTMGNGADFANVKEPTGLVIGTLKNPTKCLLRWKPDRRSNFFFSPIILIIHF